MFDSFQHIPPRLPSRQYHPSAPIFGPPKWRDFFTTTPVPSCIIASPKKIIAARPNKIEHSFDYLSRILYFSIFLGRVAGGIWAPIPVGCCEAPRWTGELLGGRCPSLSELLKSACAEARNYCSIYHPGINCGHDPRIPELNWGLNIGKSPVNGGIFLLALCAISNSVSIDGLGDWETALEAAPSLVNPRKSACNCCHCTVSFVAPVV